METQPPQSQNLRTHRVKDSPDTFFITKCLQPRKPVLDPDLRQIVVSAFDYAVRNQRIMRGAFVVMPDHWHGLFGLLGDWSLPKFMHSFMSSVGGKTVGVLQANGCAWQEGYYDTRIRSTKQFGFVGDYIIQNPVRKELVKNAEAWDASSLKFPEMVTAPWPWLFEQDYGRSRR